MMNQENLEEVARLAVNEIMTESRRLRRFIWATFIMIGVIVWGVLTFWMGWVIIYWLAHNTPFGG